MKASLILIYLICSSVFSSNCNDKVQDVYENIIKSIGNNSIYPPELIFSDSERSVAFMSSHGITIEQKAINLFCGTDNFEDKIAYILAHELAHYYLEHNWMRNTGLSYASSIGEFIEDTSYSVNQRKLAESQADLYAGFYGQIAGYNTLGFGEETLVEIYACYSLPKELKGYPSLNERLDIVNSKKEEANTLSNIFELGNVLLKTKEYIIARDCYESILKNKFNSREIYNNLGLVYLLYGISVSDKEIANLLYPVYLDYQTRANTSTTRSVDFLENSIKLFELAKTHFERAITLDLNYLPAKQNLLVAQILLAQNEKDRELFFNQVINSEFDKKTKVDFQVIIHLLNKSKLKKIKKLAKEGSYISALNYSKDTVIINSSSIKQEEILKKLNIDIMDLLMPDESENKTYRAGAIKFSSRNINEITLFEHKKNYIFKIPKKLAESRFDNNEKKSFITTPAGIYFVYKMN